ncbi:ATP-dependent RNA helicase [Borealophlyctis nickersoniae]|nr:ATP-dependent RNA helicase [Borealophlyctis nickersoniae]
MWVVTTKDSKRSGGKVAKKDGNVKNGSSQVEVADGPSVTSVPGTVKKGKRKRTSEVPAHTGKPKQKKRKKAAPSNVAKAVDETLTTQAEGQTVPIDELAWSEIRPSDSSLIAADEGLGGFFCLEEIEGVDVEYDHGVGGGTTIKFKKVKDVKPKAPPAEPTKPLPKELAEKFVNIDDFVEGGDEEMEGEEADHEAKEANDEDVDMAEDGKIDKEAQTDGTSREKEHNKGEEVEGGSEDVGNEGEDVDMSGWSTFPLSPVIVKGLRALKFTAPTEIQSKTLPVTLGGERDLIGAAETGSGKTLAFGLPILQSLAQRTVVGKEDPGCHALILAPTRELAIQVTDHLKAVAKFMRVKIVAVVGGMSAQKQRRLLTTRPDVVVATPGRLWELVAEDDALLARLRRISFLAIDEGDRMLESGHFKDLDHILAAISPNRKDDSQVATKGKHCRRTFIFSATLVDDARFKLNLSKPTKKKGGPPTFEDLLHRLEFQDVDPVYINVTPEGAMASQLLETKIDCLHTDKDAYLYYIIARYPGRTLVFVNSIDAIRRLVPVLTLMKVQAFGLHAEMQQRQRLKNLDRFRDTPSAVLIASDVAARGLDIPNVEHVVHYQLPRTGDLYVHRSGRTARAHSDGVSVMLCSPGEKPLYKKICKVLGKADGVPEFPVEMSVLSNIKQRINLARKIDQEEHVVSKHKHDKNWYKKAAEEMDIELDEDLIGSDSEDTRAKDRVAAMRRELEVMLSKPLVAKGIAGRSLTGNVGGTTLAEVLMENAGKETLMPTHRIIKATDEIKQAGKGKGKRGRSPTILASSTRTDTLIRIWKLPQDVLAQPIAGAPVREVDAAEMYLAAHEKKVEGVKFHPTVGNILASWAGDATVRLWDIEGMQDRICLSVPNDATAQSVSFDYCGDALAVGTSDGMLHVYDPRTSINPVQSVTTDHSPAKGCRVAWLTPDPLVATSGFGKQGVREIGLWDTTNLSKPVETIPVTDGSGVGILQPFWDPSLPLLYFGSRGEGIRIYELTEGVLKHASTVKVDKQATCIEMLPKHFCVSAKCEIARFLRLGWWNHGSTDLSVETTSVYVPRAQGEQTFQEDLYPPLATVDPSASADRWFDEEESIEPIMMDLVAEPIPPVRISVTSIGEDDMLSLPPPHPSVADFMQRRKSSTVRRSGSLLRRPGTLSHSSSSASIASLGGRGSVTEPPAPQPVYLDGYMDLERRGWLGSVWERRYLSLKRSRLYVSTEQDSEVPLFSVSLSAIKKVDGFAVGSNEVGFAIDAGDRVCRFKATSTSDRDHWLHTLKSLSTKGGMYGSTGLLPSASHDQLATLKVSPSNSMQQLPPPGPQSNRPVSTIVVGNREGASLLGVLSCLTSSEASGKGRNQWIQRLVVLDEEGMLHFYVDDMKAYTQGKPPLESMNLSSAISVRLVDTLSSAADASGGGHAAPGVEFQINTTKRVSFFRARKAYEAANWVMQIRRVIVNKAFLPACELVGQDCVEGPVEIVSGADSVGLHQPGSYWLSVIDGTFYYFLHQIATTPVYVVQASQFENVHVAETCGGKPVGDALPSHDPSHCFDVIFTNNVIVRHAARTAMERGVWVHDLERVRMGSFDLLGKIGITGDQQLREELGKAKADANSEEAAGVVFVDETKLSKGEQKVLIGVYGKVRLTIGMVEVSWKSLRSDAAFALDIGSTIYHWNGKSSSRVCRAKAMDVATRIRKLRSNRPRVLLVEPDDHELCAAFFSHLGLPRGTLPAQFDSTDPPPAGTLRIFRVMEALIRRRKLRLCYEGAAPSKSILEPDSVYVVQCATEVLLWMGSKSSSEHRALGSLVAKRLAMHMRESTGAMIFVQKMYEDRESAIWKEKFIDYEGSLPIAMRVSEAKGNIVTNLVQPPIDIPRLLLRLPPSPDQTALPDTGQTGRLIIYRVENFERYEVEPKWRGQLFRGESYILLYVYRPAYSGVDKCISYFWQGSASSITQKGTSALMTIELSELTGGDVVQRRVVEGKEPKHLCLLFGNQSLVVRLSTPPPAAPVGSSVIVFDIREAYDEICKAVECELNEISFNPNHVIAILSSSRSYLWYGRHSKASEQQYAVRLAGRFGAAGAPNVVVRDGVDGAQKELEAVVGATVGVPQGLQKATSRYLARLFCCSAGSGVVQIDEVPGFTQEDLDPNVVMILDTQQIVYVWFGPTSKPREKSMAMESAQKFVEQSPEHDKTKTSLLVTYAYQEPAEFTAQFQGWTRKKFPKEKLGLKPRTRPLDEVLKEYKRETYPMDVLFSDKVPEHLDRTKLEADLPNISPATKMYLEEDHFESLFKMRKEEYLALQPWKRDKVKKDIGFF